MAKVTLNWPEERWHELCDLKKLLNEVCSLNTGNMHIERTARCIELAKKLTDTDWEHERYPFTSFLEGLVLNREEEPKEGDR